MKKIILVTSFLLVTLLTANAQTLIGAGLALGGGTAIEAKADFGISEQISISPSLDYYLVDSAYSYTLIGINVDGHYNFEMGDDFVLYPLLGLNYLSISGDGFTYNSGIGVNVGGGATYAISEKMKLYGELKYRRYGSGLSVGILFSL